MKTVYYLYDEDSRGRLVSTISAPTLEDACNINGNLGVKHRVEGIISLYPFYYSGRIRDKWYCTTKNLRVVKTKRVE